MHTHMHTCTYMCTQTHRHKDAHTPTQKYINVDHAKLDTLMIRPIMIDPKVSMCTAFQCYCNSEPSLLLKKGYTY